MPTRTESIKDLEYKLGIAFALCPYVSNANIIKADGLERVMMLAESKMPAPKLRLDLLLAQVLLYRLDTASCVILLRSLRAALTEYLEDYDQPARSQLNLFEVELLLELLPRIQSKADC